ncbi:hypothetical protein F4777DRAFT_58002 [Nemania sp. FL0916]|nr:hypothetical protein F4777DRAFT_58002 [Nemania sp. FL0916]
MVPHSRSQLYGIVACFWLGAVSVLTIPRFESAATRRSKLVRRMIHVPDLVVTAIKRSPAPLYAGSSCSSYHSVELTRALISRINLHSYGTRIGRGVKVPQGHGGCRGSHCKL